MDRRATLRVNGIVIGKFDASPDDAVNAQRAQELLMRAEFEHSQPHTAAFRQAESFAYAVELLAKTGDWRAVAPIVTNGCFAVELYFKSILLADRRSERGHSLVSLFKSLSEETRLDAESIYEASDHGGESPPTFGQLLIRPDLFVIYAAYFTRAS